MRLAVLGVVLAVVLAACGGIAGDTAIHRVAYPNGYARFEFELRAGLPNGRGRTWYPNGKLQSEGTYADGARHGRFWFFTEAGAFAYQAVFFNNAEVWRSTVATEAPPAAWENELPHTVRPAQRQAILVDVPPVPPWIAQSVDPVPYFSTLDRTSSLARSGIQIGVGDADKLAFGSVTRADVFGHYRFAQFGAYGQLSQARLELPDGMLLLGRRTLELGGTYHRNVAALGALSGRAGLLVPVGHDGANGFIAGSAGVSQRPTDAADAFPSSVAVRTSSSLTRVGDRVVLQADLGIDWLFGADDRAFDALLRANGGVGFGNRSALLTFEIDNTFRASDPTRRLHALGLGGTLAFAHVWLSGCFSISQTGSTAALTSVGYDL